MGRKLIPESRGAAGFSLIELLVVIAILAVLSVGAVLSAGRGGDAGAEGADMARFRDGYATQQALAVQGRGQRGLMVRGAAMRAARPGADGWVPDRAERPWRGRVAFVKQGEAFAADGPDIRFLPDGRTSAFSIGFADGGRCESDGRAGLTCAAR